MLCLFFKSSAVQIKRVKDKAFVELYEIVGVIWAFWEERRSRVAFGSSDDLLHTYAYFLREIFQENKRNRRPNMT